MKEESKEPVVIVRVPRKFLDQAKKILEERHAIKLVPSSVVTYVLNEFLAKEKERERVLFPSRARGAN